MTGAQNPGEEDPARHDGHCLVLLLVLAVGLRVWIIPHTIVPARDGIGFMRYAWQLEHGNWMAVLRSNHHPPAYPLTIVAIAAPLRHLIGGDVLPISAQFAAALAGILLVVPMFYLGRELFDRRIGFWAAVLFQCFPVSARVLSDALSEPLFLLCSTTALLLAVRALSRPAAWRFTMCGLSAGLAYLTRPEGALLVAAVSLALIWFGCRAAMSRRTVAASLLSLWLGAAVLAGPYIGVIGHLTRKPTGQKLFEIGGQARQEMPGAGPVLLAAWYPDDGSIERSRRLVWSVAAVLSEVIKGYHGVGFFALPFGLWWFRDRFRQAPGALVLFLLVVLHAGLLVRVAMAVGYVSERHILLLLLCGMYWVVAAVAQTGDWLSAALLTAKPQAARAGAVALLLLLALAALPYTLRPLHGHRGGFRAAGGWLAEHATATDAVIDPFGWAAHYAGRNYGNNAVTLTPAVNRYVVWDCSKQSYRRAQVDAEQVREWKQGQPVYHWPVQAPLEEAEVIVYFLPAANSHR